MTNEQKFKTPEERNEAFHRYCKSVNDCSICPLGKVSKLSCPFAWLALEAKEELLPCPFCGGECVDIFETDFGRSEEPCQFVVKCHSCGALVSAEGRGATIAAWNRRAK